MKVLHVNNVDLQGRRFNGYDLLAALESRGIAAKQVVLSKLSDNPRVTPLLRDRWDEQLVRSVRIVEERHSMNNLLTPWGRLLADTPDFKEADCVHYHLIHNGMVSLLDLPWLMNLKPSVWTFHDPWAMTGHCIYPMDCDRWLRGCETCPHLDRHFPLKNDCSSRMWRVKQRVYSELDTDIVVASDFMREMVQRSPLTSGFDRVHLIPFGIDASEFLPDVEKSASRKLLGIPENDFVVLFRATTSEFKGLRYISEALGSRPPDRPTTLLTVDGRRMMDALAPSYKVVDLGWVDDPSVLPRAFSACDVLLMPSTAEAFGLMALEAMAAGRPVICFEGTAVPSVTHAPDCGIAVPSGDSMALRAAVDELAQNPAEAQRRGGLGRTIAIEQYSRERYLDSLAALYHGIEARC